MKELKPCIYKLWELYDKYKDKEHEICGDAATLLDRLSCRAEPENNDAEIYLKAYQELLQKSMELNRKLIKKTESKNSQL